MTGRGSSRASARPRTGRTMLGGIPKPLELALFTEEFKDEVQVAQFPPMRPAPTIPTLIER